MELSLEILADQLTEIKEIVYKNKETSERLEQNWDKDRTDFAEFKNRLAHLETEFYSLKDLINKLPGRTRDQVAEAAVPIMEEAHNLSDVMTDKKVVALDSQKTKKQVGKHWWKFW